MIKRCSTPLAGLFALVLLSACALVLSDKVLALDPKRPITQYIQRTWQTDQGLPQNYVTAIVQSQDGYIWLATQEGLVRFDGIKFTVFDKRNTPQIKDNNIQALFEDRAGNLWLGSEGGGLTRLSDGTFTTFSSREGLAGDIVDAIYEDREGALWVGTLNGLSRFKDGAFSSYTTKDGLANNSVLTIYEDRERRLWIGTESGLNSLVNGTFRTYTTKDGLDDNLVRVIYQDGSGDLLVGTRSGLDTLKDGRFTTTSKKQNLPNKGVLSILEDSDGNLWVGTDGGGLSRFRDGNFSTYSKKDGLSDNSVGAILEDREGNLWVGTNGGGLNCFKSGRFASYTTEEGLPDDMTRGVFEDRGGSLWVATRNGLARFAGGKFVTYTVRDGLADNSVLSFCGASNGDLWIGTRGGLSNLRGKKFTSYNTNDGLSDNTVLSIIEDREGGLWIGTGEGLNLFRNGRFVKYTTREGLTNDSIWSLCQDRDGALWIGTDGGGLIRREKEAFVAYTTNEGLANNVVLSIYDDGQGSLWIGTSGGLSRLRDGKFTNYTSQIGLFDDVIFQILQDGKGNLWMSCNKGVFSVEKKELEDFAEGIVGSIRSVAYDTTDGMKSRECNGGFQPAAWKTADGRLWFPTVRGLAVVDPDHLKINDRVPPVVIEHVIVDGIPVDPHGGPRFSAGKEKFEFHFTGLSYTAPEKVRFKYKLEGFDRDWVDAGTKRDAVYTNMRPGPYTFKVIAANNDQIWNEAGASFQFYLQPHFYQTYWFYLGCVLMTGLACWALYKLRVSQMRAQFSAVLAERTRLSREIHDTLSQSFVGVALQIEAASEELADSPESAQTRLKMAQKMVHTSLAEARRSVWDLRPQALERGNLADAFSEIVEEIMAASTVRADVVIHGKPRRLSSFVEGHLLRIGQEAISNALKHAQPTKIAIELTFDAHTVRLRVVDDGRGFESQAPFAVRSGHFGLIGIKERVGQMEGHLELRSTIGSGTEVDVSIPAD